MINLEKIGLCEKSLKLEEIEEEKDWLAKNNGGKFSSSFLSLWSIRLNKGKKKAKTKPQMPKMT